VQLSVSPQQTKTSPPASASTSTPAPNGVPPSLPHVHSAASQNPVPPSAQAVETVQAAVDGKAGARSLSIQMTMTSFLYPREREQGRRRRRAERSMSRSLGLRRGRRGRCRTRWAFHRLTTESTSPLPSRVKSKNELRHRRLAPLLCYTRSLSPPLTHLRKKRTRMRSRCRDRSTWEMQRHLRGSRPLYLRSRGARCCAS